MERDLRLTDATSWSVPPFEPTDEVETMPMPVKKRRGMSRTAHQRIGLLIFDPPDAFGIAIDRIAHDQIPCLNIEELPAFSHMTIRGLSLGQSACQQIKDGMNAPSFAVLAQAFEMRSIHQEHPSQPFAHQPRRRTRSDLEHLREHPGQPAACLPQSFAPIGPPRMSARSISTLQHPRCRNERTHRT